MPDDSERSYGYSEDIYHGPKRDEERSYEYGPEGGMEDNVELSPEEAAVHVVEPKQAGEEPVPDPEAGRYDYGRESESVDSFTWDLQEAGAEQEGSTRGEEEGKQRSEAPEEVKAGRGEPSKG